VQFRDTQKSFKRGAVTQNLRKTKPSTINRIV
jgi:hypothetical protein